MLPRLKIARKDDEAVVRRKTVRLIESGISELTPLEMASTVQLRQTVVDDKLGDIHPPLPPVSPPPQVRLPVQQLRPEEESAVVGKMWVKDT